ncbi:M-phase-specific PLK1-interacting protein [Lates japonicus]|uniref:M-phase-specific PLK1-interacting protein n=1 Tax=Lates japonicus TaxID=270547 RepID=A0AAD3RIA6_LATJO|nr:M-phase-specific PLK1-interacting protein [Lates japonicus]
MRGGGSSSESKCIWSDPVPQRKSQQAETLDFRNLKDPDETGLHHSLAAQMYRAPVRPQRSPGAPRPTGRFPSPVSCWDFPGARSPYGGSGYRGGSPRGCPPYSPGSPVYSPGSNRGYWDGSPAGFGGGSWGFGGPMRRRGDGFRRPQSFSPGSAQKLQRQPAIPPKTLQTSFSSVPRVIQTPAPHVRNNRPRRLVPKQRRNAILTIRNETDPSPRRACNCPQNQPVPVLPVLFFFCSLSFILLFMSYICEWRIKTDSSSVLAGRVMFVPSEASAEQGGAVVRMILLLPDSELLTRQTLMLRRPLQNTQRSETRTQVQFNTRSDQDQ